MEKRSKKKLWIFAIVAVVLVASGILLAVILSGGGSISSGVFIMSSENQNNGSWTFSAGRANGYKSISRNLSQEELGNFVVDSSIGDGEMALILSQGEINQTIDLSEGAMKLSAEDMDVNVFIPGQIRIRLEFKNAENLSVKIGWR